VLVLGPVRDPTGPGESLSFVSIHSETGRRLATDLGIDPDDPETNAVVLQGTAFFGRFSTCFTPPADRAGRFIDAPGGLGSS
jgi:hypothetical protein